MKQGRYILTIEFAWVIHFDVSVVHYTSRTVVALKK